MLWSYLGEFPYRASRWPVPRQVIASHIKKLVLEETTNNHSCSAFIAECSCWGGDLIHKAFNPIAEAFKKGYMLRNYTYDLYTWIHLLLVVYCGVKRICAWLIDHRLTFINKYIDSVTNLRNAICKSKDSPNREVSSIKLMDLIAVNLLQAMQGTF